jgi:sigma-B regulation protein RsbU (phosphoserine phosphatase)
MFLAGVLAAILLLSVVVSAMLGNRRTIGIPLERLLESINQSHEGGERQAVDWRSNDEIGAVVSAFNEMQERQKAYERELEEARDTLERRVEERTRELDRAQQILTDAIESISEGFSLYDNNDRLVLCNSRYRDLLYPGIEDLVVAGVPFEAIIRGAVDHGLVKDAEGRIDGWLAERLEQHRNPSGVHVQRRGDRWIQISERKTEDDGTVAIYTDITERKRAEEVLAEKEAQLRIALDNMPGGMRLVDKGQNNVLFNSQYLELYDFPDGLLKVGESKRVENLYAARRGDFGPGDPEALTDEWLAALPVQTESTSWEERPVGGKILQVSTSPTPDGGVVNIVSDITERKQAEEALAEKEAHLRVALDNMPGGMVLEDRDRKYVLFNSKYSELHDYPEGFLKVGMSAREEVRFQAERGDFGPGNTDELVEQVLETYQEGKATSWDRTFPNGRTLHFNVSPTPDGGMVEVNNDITERKQAEAALLEAHQIIKDQRDRMEDELNVGHDIQMSMIPLTFPPFPDHDEFSVFAALEPAREVGGDFYDYYFIDEERLCFCIGDVSGKGVPAALFMAMAKTLIKSRAADDRSTASILTHVNDELSADNQSCMFVTVFAGILNIRTGELLYTNAGHNPPYIKRKDGSLQCLDQRHGPVIGAVEGMVYAEGRDTMALGDLLLLFTDGVTEAMDVGDRLFSEDRLEQLLTSMDTNDADKVVDNTVAAVNAFAGEAEQADDITVLALAYHGSPEDALIAERRIVLKNHLAEIAAVNEKFETFAEEFGVPRPITMKFDIMFEEVLNNVISYAYNDDEDHDIEVRLKLVGERLVVTISDDGVPFNPLSAATPRTDLTLEDREVGGMGVHLVRNLVDDVSYQRRIDKNVLTLMSYLQQKDSAA